MAWLIKTCAAVVTAAVLGVLLKKTNVELALLLSLLTVVLIATASLSFLQGIGQLLDEIYDMTDQSELLLRPVLKCLAVSVLTKLSADLCREAGQGAGASALELAGTVCSLRIALPLLLQTMKLIGGLL